MNIEQTLRDSQKSSDAPTSRTSDNATHAFWAAFLGYALDAFDYQIFSFILTAIAAAFALTNAQAGLIATVTLVVSAFGGLLAGVLADTIGRRNTLMLTIGVYAVFTFLSGLAPNYQILLLFRSLQGLGFGGEWAAGAILIAEVADPARTSSRDGTELLGRWMGYGLSRIHSCV